LVASSPHYANKYPLHAKTIDDIIISVWARYQYVWKTEIKHPLMSIRLDKKPEEEIQ